MKFNDAFILELSCEIASEVLVLMDKVVGGAESLATLTTIVKLTCLLAKQLPLMIC